MKPREIARPRRLEHLSLDERGYPVISTIGRGERDVSFGSIEERRKLALATFDWCAVCGLPFGKEPRWQVVLRTGSGTADPLEGEIRFSEAPAHEICLVYAAHVCPHLSSPGHRLGDELRAGQRRDDEICLAGFGQTSKVEVIRSGLQRDIHVLHFSQSAPLDRFSYSRPEELADRYAELLAVEDIPELSPAETGLIDLFNGRSDAGDTVCGAALMAGASFAKDIKKVQGMASFASADYWQPLALHLLDPAKLAEFGESIDDPAGKFMAAWLIERQDNLPAILAGWRRAGYRIGRSRGIALPAPDDRGVGRTVAKNAPCPCGSGRRARRCHPHGVPRYWADRQAAYAAEVR